MKAGKCFNIGRAGSWTSFGSIAPIMSVLSASMAGERTVGELCDELDCICRGGGSLDDGDARSKVSLAGTIAGRIREAERTAHKGDRGRKDCRCAQEACLRMRKIT